MRKSLLLYACLLLAVLNWFVNYSYIGSQCIFRKPYFGNQKYHALIEDQLYIVCKNDLEKK